MDLWKRLTLVVGILMVDTVVFFIPLTALIVCFAIVARPRWFQNLVAAVYRK